MDNAQLLDAFMIVAFLAIVLAPMALALAKTGPSSAGWQLVTFLCCTFAAWFFMFASNLRIAFAAWIVAWACAMAMRMRFNRRWS